MTRSGIPAVWLAAHAHAAITLRRHGRLSDVDTIVSRVLDAGRSWPTLDADDTAEDRSVRATLADWTEAIGVYLPAIGGAQPDITLTFRNIHDMEEELDPATFQNDVAGRAVVWASRTLVAASRGDLADLTTYADVLAHGLPGSSRDAVEYAELHLMALLQGAAPLAAVAIDRANLADLERHIQGNGAAVYLAQCLERPGCHVTAEAYRENRDRAAAEHVLELAHVVKLETAWT